MWLAMSQWLLHGKLRIRIIKINSTLRHSDAPGLLSAEQAGIVLGLGLQNFLGKFLHGGLPRRNLGLLTGGEHLLEDRWVGPN